MSLKLRNRLADLSASPLVMGVLNVTPDSFSDGGDYFGPAAAVARAGEMIAEAADIIDVGPESTRPGSQGVPDDEQIARAIPVIEAIRGADPTVTISIDTRSARVARTALDAGADMVNDISALRDDPEMAETVAACGALVCLMHRRGQSADMQRDGGPHYDNVVNEICSFLGERVEYAVSRGINESRIVVDPGIGFGKRVEHNLLILKHLDRFVALGKPVLVGASRKSFIGKVLDTDDPKQRAAGSLACVAIATMAGASILRVHDVRSTVEIIRVCAAVRSAT